MAALETADRELVIEETHVVEQTRVEERTRVEVRPSQESRPRLDRELDSGEPLPLSPYAPLTRDDAEAVLGRPLADGMPAEDYFRLVRGDSAFGTGGAFRFDLERSPE